MFVISVVSVILSGIVINGGIVAMFDFFYVPENDLVWFVLALVVGGFLSGFFWAVRFKDKSPTGCSETWSGKYVMSMIVAMVLTPLLVNLILGYAKMQWMTDINDFTYDVFIVIACIFLGKYVLIALNKGLKSAYNQFKGDKQDVKDIIAEEQVTIVKKP